MGRNWFGVTMAAPAMMLMARVANHTTTVAARNKTVNDSTTASTNATFNAIINSLVFAESKSVRTSTIILASFNVLASFTTAASILYDCYWASKRCNPKFKASKFCISSIHPAETFPLVLAIGIVVQGLVFAGVQGEGLSALFTTGCEVIAQFMWPALFIVPYIQLVFGVECALRSLRRLPFQPRGKYDVTICCGAIVLMLIVTWIPSHIFPEPDACFASLVWFITRYGKLGFVLLSTAGGLMILSAITIFVRLSTVNQIDEHQRIAASRMVYYLALGIVSLAFVIPYFFSLVHGEGDIKLAMMATVVLNLSGLMSGLLQLFLRSNTATTSFGPKIGRSWDRGKHEIRMFGPNELAFTNHLNDPASGPRTPKAELEGRTDSRAGLIEAEKGSVISMESLQSPSFRSPKQYEGEMSRLPTIPEPTNITISPTAARTHIRNKPSYTLFPVETSPSKTQRQEPTSIYDISDLGDLEPPPPIHYAGGPRHKRDSSIASSATVQIGLRLSHAPSPSQDSIKVIPLPSATYNAISTPAANANRETCPALLPTTYSATPKPKVIPTSKFTQMPKLPPSPLSLEVQTTFPLVSGPPAGSPRRPSPLNTDLSRSLSQTAQVNKTLPPTPKALLPKLDTLKQQSRESNTQLSPAVYSPEKEKKVVTAANVARGPMSATLPTERGNPLKSNPLGSPVRIPARSNSSAARPLNTTQAKGDWI